MAEYKLEIAFDPETLRGPPNLAAILTRPDDPWFSKTSSARALWLTSGSALIGGRAPESFAPVDPQRFFEEASARPVVQRKAHDGDWSRTFGYDGLEGL